MWGSYVLLIYGYLYACMFFGEPFIAFDHENYINFLNDPFPFFFEPGYTVVAYIVNSIFPEVSRFPVVFAIFTLPPFLLVWKSTARSPIYARGMMIYACVLTKSFYIGFVAQRFFFAELWVSALIIASMPNLPKYRTLLIPSLVHFSSLAVLPCVAWLNSVFSWRRFNIYICLLLVAYLYINVFSGFQLLGYDYSRYLDNDELAGKLSLFSFIQTATLLAIFHFILPKTDVRKFTTLVCLIFVTKLLFAEIEVFSRIIQIQTDAALVLAGLRARRSPVLIYLFCLGFLILQMFFTQTSIDMAIYHSTAAINAWQSF